jgi:AcrR family transcriptional regulator
MDKVDRSMDAQFAAETPTAGGSRGAQSRAALIRAGSELLIERGQVDFTLADLAKRSGLNGALVKYYFGNKDALLFEVLMEPIRAGIASLKKLSELDVPAKVKLEYHVAGLLRTNWKYPYLNQLVEYFTALGEKPYITAIQEELLKPTIALQQGILNEGVKAGEFRPVEHEFFYFSLSGLCNELVRSRTAREFIFNYVEVSAERREGYARYVCDLFLNGLLRRDAPNS